MIHEQQFAAYVEGLDWGRSTPFRSTYRFPVRFSMLEETRKPYDEADLCRFASPPRLTHH